MDELGQVLTAVGPRLRALRQQRNVTLTDLAATTGISVSTLSRLESGQRRPSLELLLPLAKAHGVRLDQLVSPPPEDPRIVANPIRRKDVTYLPLTRRPGGMQAYKLIFLPRPDGVPQQRTHEGYEWLYVLSGRLRLVLGEHDFIVTPGEAVEFDTHVPHWFGNPGPEPAEALSLFGTQGERIHVRARSR